MIRKIIAGCLVFATTTLFSMSLSQLNSASKSELMEINGIGEVKAAAIIKERRKGKFKSFEDLQRVEGIGEQTADNIRRGVKSSAGVKKVKKTTKKNSAKKKTSAKKKSTDKKETTAKKKRKIKSTEEKKKTLKTKSRKTKEKKSKTKKTKAKKEKKSKNKS